MNLNNQFSGMSLKKLIQYNEASAPDDRFFMPRYFPILTEIGGRTFIQSQCQYKVSGVIDTIDKYLIFDKAGKFLKESCYEFIEYPKFGYLMKLQTNAIRESADMKVVYFVDVNEVYVTDSMTLDEDNSIHNLKILVNSDKFEIDKLYKSLEMSKNFSTIFDTSPFPPNFPFPISAFDE